MKPRAAPLLALALACGGCGKPAAHADAPPSLHLAPLTDLAQAAELAWLVDVAPRALATDARLAPAIAIAFPRERSEKIAEDNGGIDLTALDELVVASYAGDKGATTLWLARGSVDPGSIETAFKHRAEGVEGRAVDHGAEGAADAIVRTWGSVAGEREQIAIFGRSAAGLEVGRLGPLRVAELFAQQRLHKAIPALRAPVLARAAEILRGDAPADPSLRAFALGPFVGDDARALAGLLAASTAVAMGARVTEANGEPALEVTLVLTGAWDRDAPRAAERLLSAFGAISTTPLGRLAGLDHPLVSPTVDTLESPKGAPTSAPKGSPPPPTERDALRLRVTLSALALARGARAASGAEVREMMSY